jgi:Uma2 family endonuclease
MTIATERQITLENFLKLPETKPASEFIKGEILQKPMPQGEHSLIQTTFIEVVNGLTRSQKIAIAFSELRCTFVDTPRSKDTGILNRIIANTTARIISAFQVLP